MVEVAPGGKLEAKFGLKVRAEAKTKPEGVEE